MNECLINTGNCTEFCTNTVGSYICSCHTGYKVNADGKTCIGMDS